MIAPLPITMLQGCTSPNALLLILGSGRKMVGLDVELIRQKLQEDAVGRAVAAQQFAIAAVALVQGGFHVGFQALPHFLDGAQGGLLAAIAGVFQVAVDEASRDVAKLGHRGDGGGCPLARLLVGVVADERLGQVPHLLLLVHLGLQGREGVFVHEGDVGEHAVDVVGDEDAFLGYPELVVLPLAHADVGAAVVRAGEVVGIVEEEVQGNGQGSGVDAVGGEVALLVAFDEVEGEAFDEELFVAVEEEVLRARLAVEGDVDEVLADSAGGAAGQVVETKVRAPDVAPSRGPLALLYGAGNESACHVVNAQAVVDGHPVVAVGKAFDGHPHLAR